MDKIVQFLTIEKRQFDLNNISRKRIVFTLHIPEALLNNMFEELSDIEKLGNLWMLDYKKLCYVYNWMRILYGNTCGKSYTEEFECELNEFLNPNSGMICSLIDDIERTGEENTEYYVFMRLLDA